MILLAAEGLSNDQIASRSAVKSSVLCVNGFLPNASLVWINALVRVVPGLFPPDLVVQVRAWVCELPTLHDLPLSRWSTTDLAREVCQSGWSHRSFIFPRDPNFADKTGRAGNVRFTFANGDRVMTQLADDTDLKDAEIDLCLFRVNSGILLQLWKGVIQNFTSDGPPIFPVTCSDGFFQIMKQYPERQVSRQCWKTYNDGVNCPRASKGRSASAVTAAGGDPTSCDYCLESANGCQVHGMSPFFGGQPGRPARRRDQGQFHRLPRLRPQHCHRHFHPFRHRLGPGAAGDLVQ